MSNKSLVLMFGLMVMFTNVVTATPMQHPDPKQLVTIAFDGGRAMSERWKSFLQYANKQKSGAKTDIIRAAQSSEWFMRTAAMHAMVHVSKEESQRLARTLIKDKALVVRSAAVDFLENDHESRGLLKAAFRDPQNKFKNKSLWIRTQILEVLSRKPEPKDVEFFISALRENDGELQKLALVGIEKSAGLSLGLASESTQVRASRWVKWWENRSRQITIQ